MLIVIVISLSIVLWTYAVFPCFIALWSSLFGKAYIPETISDSNLPVVVMVVPAYNEESTIAEKIANTWESDYPAEKLFLFVGSDGSTDQTNALISECSNSRTVKFLFQNRRGKVSVLNELITGEELQRIAPSVIMLSDANTMFEPETVRTLATHFVNPKVGCVNGSLGYSDSGGVSGEGIYWKHELWLKKCESTLGFVVGCYGGVMAIRRELFKPQPANTITEDFVISMDILRQGYLVRFDSNAGATEAASASSRAEWKRKVRIGAGNFQAIGMTADLLSPRYGLIAFCFWSHKILRWFAPFFLVLTSVAIAWETVLAQFSPGSVWTWLSALGVLAVATATYVYGLPENHEPPKWAKPIGYFVLMNAALIAGFFRWAKRSQPVTWERAQRAGELQSEVPNNSSVDNSVKVAKGRSHDPDLASIHEFVADDTRSAKSENFS